MDTTPGSQKKDVYKEAITELLHRGLISERSEILVLCAGELDRDTFLDLGFGNVTLSNLNKNADPDRFAPCKALSLDAEEIDLPDESFDFVFVQSGLHHCASPHRAILEMYRVARVGLFAAEPRDGFISRLAVKLGFGQQYEIGSVRGKEGYRGGGLRFGGIPNWVYRFTAREIIQTIQTAHPEAEHEFIFQHLLVIPWTQMHKRGGIRKLIALGLGAMMPLIGRLPFLANNLYFTVLKPRFPQDLQPWLRMADGEIVFAEAGKKGARIQFAKE